jgi:RimJ/RimL family protein N-acetyltransferase
MPPGSANEWAALGAQLVRSGATRAQAKEAFRKAWALDTGAVPVALALGRLCVLDGDASLAESVLYPVMARLDANSAYVDEAATLLIKVHLRLGQPDQARGVIQQLDAMGRDLIQEPWRTLRRSVAPAWWVPHVGARSTLRRASGDDAHAMKAMFENPAFAMAVNRDYAEEVRQMPVQTLQQTLDAQSKRSSMDMGQHVSLVFAPQGQLLGIACLVDMDLRHSRAEFIIGFLDPLPAWPVVLEAGLYMADLAFNQADLNRVSCSVYSDNPRMKMLERMLGKLGFQAEGCLREHVRGPDGRPCDVHQWGCLAKDFTSNPFTQGMLRRSLAARPIESR